jgi:hypothetical protein
LGLTISAKNKKGEKEMGLFDKLLDFANEVLSGGGKIKKNDEVSQDKKPLLTTGAILIYANQWQPQTLAINSKNQITPQRILTGFWGVQNKEESLGLIDKLLTDGDHKELDPLLEKYFAGDTSVFSAQQTAMFKYVVDEIMVGCAWDGVKIKKEDISWTRTAIAWDIERAAFIARMAFNCKYISEQETWDILKATRNLAELHFADWRDYLFSFMIGRALIMHKEEHKSAMGDVFSKALLLKDKNWGDVWLWSPLKTKSI